MFAVPAVCLGALVVFGIGYIITSAVLNRGTKSKKGNPVLYRDTLKEVKQPGSLTEKEIDEFAKIGGGIAVLLMVLLLFVVPREWATIIWVGLTVIGIIVGLLTFGR
jgi:hypothetical protein